MAVSIHPNTSVATCVEGLVYAVNSGAQIINISWGTPFESDALREAMEFVRRNNVFAALAAGYGVFEPRELVATARRDGLKRLGARLRHIERREDPDGRIYPRMKPSDDATAVLFEIRKASD